MDQKLWYIYTMEFYTAERKKELLPFVTAWVDLESIMLSEISEDFTIFLKCISQPTASPSPRCLLRTEDS